MLVRCSLRPLSIAAALAAWGLTTVHAEDFIVTDQAEFDAAIAVATQPGRDDTIIVDAQTISSGPSLMLPAAATGITINFNGVSGGSGDNPTFNVGFGDTGSLVIADGTTLNFDTANGIARFNVGRTDGSTGGTGTVTMTGGLIQATAVGGGTYFALDVGRGIGSQGTFNQSGGTFNLAGGAFQIGVVGGTGTYTMSNDAVVNLGSGQTIYVGEGAGGEGTLNIHDSAQFLGSASGTVFIGHNGGTGTINQDGPASRVSFNTTTYLGGGGPVGSTGGTGTYNISAGALEIGGIFNMGLHAASLATINQSGGTVTLNNQMRFGAGEGIYNLNGGTLQINNANPFTTGAGTHEFNLGGGTIQSLTSFSSVATLNFTLIDGTTSTIDTTTGTTATFNGVFAGDGALAKIGGGTLVLNGANTFTGGTVLDGGTTVVGSDTAFGTGDVTFAGDSMVQFGGSYTLANPMLINSGVVATFDTNGNTGTLDGIISGAGALVKDGTGTLVLDAANTYTGGTVIASGVLQLGASGSLASASALQVDAGATFNLAAHTQEVAALYGAGNITGTGILIAGGNNENTAFSGTIDAEFHKVGSGILVIDGATFGETYVFDGRFAQTSGTTAFDYLGLGEGVGGTGILDVSGGTVSFGTALQVGDWGGTGTVNQTGGTVRIEATCGTSSCPALNIGNQGGQGVYNISGGLLELNGGSHTLGRSAGSNPASHGTLNISGDALVVLQPAAAPHGTGLLVIGSRDLTSHAGGQGTGEINQTGGTLRIEDGSRMHLSGYGEGVYNFLGGMLQVGGNGLRGNYAGGADYEFNIGNATIQAYGTALTTSVNATLLDGALATIDTNGLGATWTGILSGTGALRKLGDGTLVLNAANTYSGGTWIADGTLQLGALGSLASTGAVQVDADGTFDVNGRTQTIGAFSGAGDVLLGSGQLTTDSALNTIYSGSMSGPGSFIKEGTGTLEMTGASTYTGATILDGGKLVVNGSLASEVTVESGVLGGIGTIGGLIVSGGGTMAPGNSIGTINVSGNTIFQVDSIYEVEVDGAGNSDKIETTGTATINGGVVNVLPWGSAAPSLMTYTILTSQGARQGEFDGVISNFAFIEATLDYDANNVYLNLARNNVSFADAGVTPNQRSVGSALDGAPPSSAIVQSILGLSEVGAQEAYNALSGEVHASAASMMVLDSYYVRDSIFSRLRQASYSSVSGGQSVAFANTGPMTVALADPGSRMSLGMGPDVHGGSWQPVAPSSAAGPVFWTQGFGAWGGLGGDGNAAGLDRSLGGFVSGVDGGLGSGWRAGLATGYMHSSLSAGARSSSAAIDSFILAAYAGGPVGDFALRTGGAWSWQWVDTKRNVTFPGFFEVERADYTADTGQLFAEIAYPLLHGRSAWEPFASISYIHVGTGSFSEGPSDAALLSGGADQNLGMTVLGVRAATTLPWYGMQLTPYGSAGWQYAFGDLTPTQSFAFTSANVGFGIAGVPLARSSALLEAGVDLAIAPGTTVGIGYIGQIGEDLHDNSVQGRLNWQF